MPSAKKRSRAQANAAHDLDEDIGTPFALGADPSSSSSSKQNAALAPAEDKEIDLEKLIFGNVQSLLSAPAASASTHDHDPLHVAKRHKLPQADDTTAAVADDQLFMLDTVAGDDNDHDDDQQDALAQHSDVASSDGDQEDDQVFIQHPDTQAGSSAAASSSKRHGRASVWTDPDDASLTVNLAGKDARAADGSRAGTKKLRKLREQADEQSISGHEYELRLRKQFEKIHPRPIWAALRLFTRDHPEASQAIDHDSGISVSEQGHRTLTELLRTDSQFIGSSSSSSRPRSKLKSGEIELDRLRNANDAQTSAAVQNGDAAAAIEMIQFHPSQRASVLLTASRDRRVRLFQIDGNTNPLLQTLHLPDLPVQHASFHPSGSSVLISGTRPYLYAYDLQAGRVIRSSPWRGSGSLMSQSTGDDGVERDLSLARFQPNSGDGGNRLLAIAGRNGAVHLLDWGRSGAAGGARIGGLRMNAPLAGMCWSPIVSDESLGVNVGGGSSSTSSSSSDVELMTLSTHGSVHVWDVRNTATEVSCTSIYSDPGSYGAQGLEISPSARHWAVGSDSGIVNIYKRPESSAGGNMEPVKGVGNLTTASTTMQWNHDGQILGIASRAKKDALRLVHFPTMRVFANWPTSGTPLGHVTSLAFSPASQYVAIGNNRGKVLLYSLRHYM